MKKVLAVAILTLATLPAIAQWHHGHHGHHGGYRGPAVVYRDNWIAPLIFGGIAGAIIARETAPVVVQQPPVYVQQQPQPLIIQRQSVCTEWKEIQNSEGVIYRERTCVQ